MRAHYLADKSALARMRHAIVRDRLAPLLEEGALATCGIVELEVLFSARTHADLVETHARRAQAYERALIDDLVLDRAMDVQALLGRRGKHRLPIADLIIAAAAERAGLCVLHYDADFDRIAEVTGQAVEWVVPRGSVD